MVFIVYNVGFARFYERNRAFHCESPTGSIINETVRLTRELSFSMAAARDVRLSIVMGRNSVFRVEGQGILNS